MTVKRASAPKRAKQEEVGLLPASNENLRKEEERFCQLQGILLSIVPADGLDEDVGPIWRLHEAGKRDRLARIIGFDEKTHVFEVIDLKTKEIFPVKPTLIEGRLT